VFWGFVAYSLIVHSPLEEIFWRAVVTDPGHPGRGMLVAGNALGFGLLHAIPMGMILGWPGVLMALPTAAAGAIWAWVTIRTRSLWPALVSHWGADALILAGMWFFFIR
jgi:membrane protease YdiL (CAAX protease family)